ncbi:MAG: rhomboid family intramembrane serine protease [Planctomycetes bacterium]|nr:rhomboid family intramembrane serine protease [Planctomycetota bacterium]
MASDDEIVSRTADSAAPIPVSAGGSPHPKLTPDTILKWIAAAGDQPWFPSRHAETTGTSRTELDEPLGQLRLADLVRVATWIRGVGQGYVLTPEGVALVASGSGFPSTVVDPQPKSAAVSLEESTPKPTSEEQATRHFGLNRRTPVFVPMMLMANVCWFGVGAVAAMRGGHPIGEYLGQGQPRELLHHIGAIKGNDLLHGEWWRLLSSCFVHFGLVHLLANMFALAMMGSLAELLWGRWRLTTIYLISGLAGSCLAMANKPEGMLAGASGAIWGILASLLAWLMWFRHDLPPDVRAEWARRLWLAFLLNAGVSFLPNISWEAHLGGCIAGFLVSWALNALRFARRPQQFLALVSLLAIPAFCVAGLMMSMQRSQVWESLRKSHANEVRRTAERERLPALIAAEEAYNRDVVPRLIQLSPDGVSFVRHQAWAMLYKPRTSRNPEIASEIIAKLTELKATANEVITLLAGLPTDWEPPNGLRTRARQFAEARVAEMDELLGMLDSPILPKQSDWSAWGDARRAADAAWDQLRQK